MTNFSLKQKNNLVTGNILAVEIPASSDELRCFITIGAYKLNERGTALKVSKLLNCNDKNEIQFWLRKYEVKKEYINNEDDISCDQLINSIYIKNIENVELLESELSKYISDFSELDVEWKCDNPI